MGYLLAQIFFCLLLAFALGLVIGWFLRALRRDDPTPADTRALTDARARIAALELDLAACRADAAAAPPAPEASGAAIAAASGSVASGGMALFGEAADAPIDDLKKISGIGSVIETQLAGIGITTYRQIANLTAEDVERVNDAIEVFQGRIERENWISQAADLHREAYDSEP